MNHAGYALGLVISVVKSSMMSALCLWPRIEEITVAYGSLVEPAEKQFQVH